MKNSKEPEPLDPNSFPHKPRYGHLPGTIENMEHLLDGYGISVRYDVIRKRMSIRSTLLPEGSDNSDESAMAHIVSLACLNRFPRGNVEAYVGSIADSRSYNPVKEWIGSKPWDGRCRLQEIYATVHEQDDFPPPLKETLMRKWLLSAAAAALLPKDFRCRGVLTFQGPQNIGKTQWVWFLVSDPELRALVIKLDHNLDASQKDSIIGAVSHWIVELGELDSAMRRDIARLKGVLTRNTDKVRKPYFRVESEMPRRTVFVATVNHSKFLADETGNSRWWIIPVVGIEWRHNINMQQLFAQLAKELADGAEWWLDAAEEKLLEEYNRRHRVVSAIEDMVLDAIDLERVGEPDLGALTPRQLLVLIGIERPTNLQCKECGGVLRDYLGLPKRIQGRERWRVPLIDPLHKEWLSTQQLNKKDKYD